MARSITDDKGNPGIGVFSKPPSLVKEAPTPLSEFFLAFFVFLRYPRTA